MQRFIWKDVFDVSWRQLTNKCSVGLWYAGPDRVVVASAASVDQGFVTCCFVPVVVNESRARASRTR